MVDSAEKLTTRKATWQKSKLVRTKEDCNSFYLKAKKLTVQHLYMIVY